MRFVLYGKPVMLDRPAWRDALYSLVVPLHPFPHKNQYRGMYYLRYTDMTKMVFQSATLVAKSGSLS